MHPDILRIGTLFDEVILLSSLFYLIRWLKNCIQNKEKKSKNNERRTDLVYILSLLGLASIIAILNRSRVLMVLDEYHHLFTYRTIYRFFTLKGGEIIFFRNLGWPLFLANISFLTGLLGYNQVFLINKVIYIITVPLIYKLISKISNSKNFAFFISILYATNESIIFLAFSGENHTLANLFLVLGFIVLFDFFKKPSKENVSAALWTFVFSAVIRPENFIILALVTLIIIYYTLNISKRKRIKGSLLLISEVKQISLIFAVSLLEVYLTFVSYSGMYPLELTKIQPPFSLWFFLREILQLNSILPISIFTLFIISTVIIIIKKDLRGILTSSILFLFLVLFYIPNNFTEFDLYRFHYTLILPMYLTISISFSYLIPKKRIKNVILLLFMLLALVSIWQVQYFPEVYLKKSLYPTLEYVECLNSIKFTKEESAQIVIAPIKYQFYFLKAPVILDYEEFQAYQDRLKNLDFILILDQNYQALPPRFKTIVLKSIPWIEKLKEEEKIKKSNEIYSKEGCNLEFYESVPNPSRI